MPSPKPLLKHKPMNQHPKGTPSKAPAKEKLFGTSKITVSQKDAPLVTALKITEKAKAELNKQQELNFYFNAELNFLYMLPANIQVEPYF
jgi:hypothetical protein